MNSRGLKQIPSKIYGYFPEYRTRDVFRTQTKIYDGAFLPK